MESIFRDLQDLHTFAPLRSYKFNSKLATFCEIEYLNIQSKLHMFSIKNAISRRNLDKFLSDFREHAQKCPNSLRMPEHLQNDLNFGKNP